MSQLAVFLDRDGTINEEMGYINHLSRFRLLPQAVTAIRRLNAAGVKVVVVTNQSGAARGYFPASLVDEIHAHLQKILAAGGAHLDGIYACLHGPDEGCACRKPRPTLMQQAARDLDLDLSRSYLVGDRYKDVETAANAGVKGILVLTGYGRGEYDYLRPTQPVQPVHVAGDLLEGGGVDFAGFGQKPPVGATRRVAPADPPSIFDPGHYKRSWRPIIFPADPGFSWSNSVPSGTCSMPCPPWRPCGPPIPPRTSPGWWRPRMRRCCPATRPWTRSGWRRGLRPAEFFSGSNPATLRRLIKLLRSRLFDLVVDVQGLLKSAVWVALARSPRKVGYDQTRELSYLALTERVPPFDPEAPRGQALPEPGPLSRGPPYPAPSSAWDWTPGWISRP